MSGTRRKALLVSAALVSGALLMTACGESDKAAGTGAAKDAAAAAPAGNAAGATPNGSTAETSDKGSEKSADKGSDKGSSGQGTDKSTDNGGDKGGASGQGRDGSGVDRGDGVRVPVQQSCGANDLSWSTRSESQAGGYILVMAKAKPGITCVLPEKHPVVAFGSDGTEAGPAEQSLGKAITLSGNKTAYAGVNPKTTNTDSYKELNFIIVAPENNDSDPVELKTGPIRVDKPIVTNWHTSAKDAVPFG
ncbi:MULTISPECIES: DUF4232 domain-containing protein [Streptomyces]|uniref:DUF4232 domain-containing protein n=1 Tax=Streptomyces tsukubensis (strain DSM 42081 / NBRC 108919 / NRRL 18488 / 9993) TaxID=1114943 RepID=I2N0N9_STRT9|nr:MULTISPECIES: DUF4232 domain-containing protein [Streptomyces]AZK94782.1 hypothetical protein B7R87_13595 [Streptomyces tsukubensis]EIF90586.1 hypothetical protein [Streptomyces tsukubensis NRRL18488]MYS68722.1 hypothetical protein [Streptomyces sp. SID5473]QKM69136.1 hypothetical protein STSU_020175 [Streptomyces tsukubensis NRRL18488]TAI42934.1 hypothetical protein EWI31_21360 [Streptomyces tsukubensis]